MCLFFLLVLGCIHHTVQLALSLGSRRRNTVLLVEYITLFGHEFVYLWHTVSTSICNEAIFQKKKRVCNGQMRNALTPELETQNFGPNTEVDLSQDETFTVRCGVSFNRDLPFKWVRFAV
jgi:hypothetical protein